VLNFGLAAPVSIQIQDQNLNRGYAAAQSAAIDHRIPALSIREFQVLDFPHAGNRG